MPSPTPTRSIRALYDTETITLYQAYNTTIAHAAVQTQRLDASPLFNPTRTTWLKPSWNWMMYRSGYSYKDPNQACILALRVRHESFKEMLGMAVVSGEGKVGGDGVVVQWDPERSVRIGRVEGVRSLQVGVKGGLVGRLVGEWIVGIEDVTGRARGMKEVVEGGGGEEELRRMELLPVERVYDFMLGVEVRRRLGMEVESGKEGSGSGSVDVEEEEGEVRSGPKASDGGG